MKCLSLKPPYAELLVSGKKTIELRKWNTKFRGDFLIHASKTIDKDSYYIKQIRPDKLVTGAIIGKAYLYDVKKYNDKKSFLEDKNKHLSENEYDFAYGFLIKNPIKFEKPILFSGKLGFFEVDEKIIDIVNQSQQS